MKTWACLMTATAMAMTALPAAAQSQPAVPGHRYGEKSLAAAPYTMADLASLADVEKMHAAWVKAVLLQSILWSRPYIKDGEF